MTGMAAIVSIFYGRKHQSRVRDFGDNLEWEVEWMYKSRTKVKVVILKAGENLETF